jgi:hypothetical protein
MYGDDLDVFEDVPCARCQVTTINALTFLHKGTMNMVIQFTHLIQPLASYTTLNV